MKLELGREYETESGEKVIFFQRILKGHRNPYCDWDNDSIKFDLFLGFASEHVGPCLWREDGASLVEPALRLVDRSPKCPIASTRVAGRVINEVLAFVGLGVLFPSRYDEILGKVERILEEEADAIQRN